MSSRTTTTVVAVGIDIVDLDEIADSLARHGDRYLRRVFTERECEPWEGAGEAGRRSGVRRLAACFAVKEATLKVLGPHDDDAVDWRCIDVQPEADSDHLVELSGAGAGLAARRGIDWLSGSVQVTRGHAIAVVLGGRVGVPG